MGLESAVRCLDEYGFKDRVKLLDESSATVDLAAEAVGVEPDQIAKTLSFLVKDVPVLVLASGKARIDNHKFKEEFKTKAKMIHSDQVEALVGHAPGGVCPFGVKEGVQVYLDNSLKKHEVVYPAAGTGNSAVKLTVPELEKCSGYLKWIDVCK
ncbi:MAG: YbaK/EbsC family protein [Eubacteriales bacterium]|uniref:YbaK/EbsC family protein n=2 Tax=Baileyella intestinalis TaxID=2606709 RepID=A0A6A8M8E2_9FIRM|nr:YbaK/EbsC family protein [Baileyella intestinalis]MCI7686192.1 YbaK/EbsC family protein [Clostridiales bacterium]MDY2994877.1 YbaK/EbsC family protein [Baileyella intestinalis]MST68980.1 YbaK/EbsC family protein [Baileyella intestinalis]